MSRSTPSSSSQLKAQGVIDRDRRALPHLRKPGRDRDHRRRHLCDGQPAAAASVGEPVEVLLPETVFYVETGGQVSDTGEIYYWPEDLDEPVWTVR
jgi:hypothetical protein